MLEKLFIGSDSMFWKKKKKTKQFDALFASLIPVAFYLAGRIDLQLLKTSDIGFSKLPPLAGNSTSFFELCTQYLLVYL